MLVIILTPLCVTTVAQFVAWAIDVNLIQYVKLVILPLGVKCPNFEIKGYINRKLIVITNAFATKMLKIH